MGELQHHSMGARSSRASPTFTQGTRIILINPHPIPEITKRKMKSQVTHRHVVSRSSSLRRFEST